MTAADSCGGIGPKYDSPFFSFVASDISTFPLSNVPTARVNGSTPLPYLTKAEALNVADLECPFYGAAQVPVTTSVPEGVATAHYFYGSPWLPVIAPPSKLLSFDPTWLSVCPGIATDGYAQHVGMYDPPRALVAMKDMAMPSTSAIVAAPTKPPAQPGQSVTPDTQIATKAAPPQVTDMFNKKPNIDPDLPDAKTPDLFNPPGENEAADKLPSPPVESAIVLPSDEPANPVVVAPPNQPGNPAVVLPPNQPDSAPPSAPSLLLLPNFDKLFPGGLLSDTVKVNVPKEDSSSPKDPTAQAGSEAVTASGAHGGEQDGDPGSENAGFANANEDNADSQLGSSSQPSSSVPGVPNQSTGSQKPAAFVSTAITTSGGSTSTATTQRANAAPPTTTQYKNVWQLIGYLNETVNASAVYSVYEGSGDHSRVAMQAIFAAAALHALLYFIT